MSRLPRPSSTARQRKRPASAPVVEPPSNNMAGQLQTFVAEQSAKALVVMAELVMAILLTFFLLAAGDTFRRKVAHLAGVSLARRRVTVEVLNEIDAQIQPYMVTLLVANALIALATWAALAVLGSERRDVGRVRRRTPLHPVCRNSDRSRSCRCCGVRRDRDMGRRDACRRRGGRDRRSRGSDGTGQRVARSMSAVRRLQPPTN